MKRAPVMCRKRCFIILVVFCLAACWGLPGRAGAVDSAGLILSIHTDKNQYQPGEPVSLTMVLKYDSAAILPIITKRGFSDSKNLVLHRFLSVTDPGGKTHLLGGVPKAHTMEPADYEDDQGEEFRFVETLGNQIPISETIQDLLALTAELVNDASGIQNTNGWFTLRAVISAYVRFDPQQTKSHYFLGPLGKIGANENYVGPIESNPLRFFVSPTLGAQFEIQVLDQGLPAPEVPVKVFRTSEIPPGVEPLDLWSGLPGAQPVLTGTTDLASGTVKQWESGSPCQTEGDYTVFAYYGGTFGQAPIQTGDDGWLPECSGLIETTILFGQPPPTETDRFSVFGLNSVRIGKRAVVLSGNIGVNAAASGSKRGSGAVAFIGSRADLRPGTRIYADSVRIEKGAVVYDVYYNQLDNRGKILGEMTTPLELPVWEPPAFVESAPGNEDIIVKGIKGKKGKKDRHVVELAAGLYDEVKIDDRGELHLLGGTYHFRSMVLDKEAALVCRGPATILIKEDLRGDDKVYIGPDADAAISAANIVIYVGGIEEKKEKKKKSKPKIKKVVIGKKSRVIANIYAPHSSLVIEKESEVEGSLIAAEVIVGDKATVEYKSAF